MRRFQLYSRLPGAGLVALLVSASIAHADVSILSVVGPVSGTGFANVGAASFGIPDTELAQADVSVVLRPGEGTDLLADCSASFDLVTSGLTRASAPTGPVKGRVGFPFTGQGRQSVELDSFAVKVDGVSPTDLALKYVRFPTGKIVSPLRDVIDVVPDPRVSFLNEDGRLMAAYVWTQQFEPGRRARVAVHYQLRLHAQSLQYGKRIMKGASPDVVPFDLMLVGESTERGYFFDYILRSGSTWSRDIGHETVTLSADPAMGLDFDQIVLVERNVAGYFWDVHSESFGRWQAGLDAPHCVRRPGAIVWEIKDEKPQEDILVEIPLAAIRRPPPR